MTNTKRTANNCPRDKGSYMLLVKVSESVHINCRWNLAPGVYVYVGSAGGPGGLRARIQRHLRRAKKVHWHIDHLTASGKAHVLGAFYSTGGWGVRVEACLSRCLEAQGHAVIERFGSTDDRIARGHLFKLGTGEESIDSLGACMEKCGGGKTGFCRSEELGG